MRVVWRDMDGVLSAVGTTEFIGVMKKLDKFVDDELADMRGVLEVDSPSIGEFGSVKFGAGELGLLFFNLCCTYSKSLSSIILARDGVG